MGVGVVRGGGDGGSSGNSNDTTATASATRQSPAKDLPTMAANHRPKSIKNVFICSRNSAAVGTLAWEFVFVTPIPMGGKILFSTISR